MNTRPIAHRIGWKHRTPTLEPRLLGECTCINKKPNTVHNTTQNSPQTLTSLH